MNFSQAIFNEKGRFHWASNNEDIARDMTLSDFDDNWYVADFFYPDFPDYDAEALHSSQVADLLATPEKLVPLKLTAELKKLLDPARFDMNF